MKKIIILTIAGTLFLASSTFGAMKRIEEEGIKVNEIRKTVIPEAWGEIIAIHREAGNKLIIYLSSPDALRIIFGRLYSDDFIIEQVIKIRRRKEE